MFGRNNLKKEGNKMKKANIVIENETGLQDVGAGTYHCATTRAIT